MDSRKPYKGKRKHRKGPLPHKGAIMSRKQIRAKERNFDKQHLIAARRFNECAEIEEKRKADDILQNDSFYVELSKLHGSQKKPYFSSNFYQIMRELCALYRARLTMIKTALEKLRIIKELSDRPSHNFECMPIQRDYNEHNALCKHNYDRIKHYELELYKICPNEHLNAEFNFCNYCNQKPTKLTTIVDIATPESTE